jgi:multiple sugar transport system substrate-binding protein
VILASTILAGTGGTAAATSQPSRPYAGVTITVWNVQDPQSTAMATTLAAFTKQTGIKVNMPLFPEEALGDKLVTSLTAKDSSFDVYYETTTYRAQYAALNGAAPLDPYIKDPKQTPASWDYADFPAAVTGTCMIGATTYCLPLFADSTMLYYNKTYLREAGLSHPPQSMAELVADALKLTTKSHAGICMRGSASGANVFPALMLLLYYLPYKNGVSQGVYWDKNWNPLLTTPQALAFGKAYQTLMTKAAPRGVVSYAYQDCLNDFNQGRVAMFLDASDFVGRLTDPTTSKILNEGVGFDFIPCPATDATCSIIAPWGGYVNQNSRNKAAAWQVLQYLSSKQVESTIVNDTGEVTFGFRNSVLDSAKPRGKPIPTDEAAALKAGFAHSASAAIPNIPEAGQVFNALGLALSEIASGQASPQSALASAQQQTVTILKKAGYLK